VDLRIAGQQVKAITDTYKAAVKPKAEEQPSPAASGDSVVLSPEAQSIRELTQLAEAKVKDLPAVREQLVAELRDKIGSGQYRVDPRAVAERMLQDMKNRG
jgi:flagellar biosynthesis anti-sigma factor FlgM